MSDPSLTPAEQLLLDGALAYLTGRQPERTDEALEALDTYTGPVLVDAVTLARNAYVDYGPTLTQRIADLNALRVKITPAAGGDT